MMVSITLNTKELHATLKNLKQAVRGRSINALSTGLEITVSDGLGTFAIYGGKFSIKGITSGTCRATISFIHFWMVIRDLKSKELEIFFTDDTIKINRATLVCNSIEFDLQAKPII